MSFPRYPAYKYSGVEWLGEIPEHWQVKPLKRVAEIQTGLAKGKDVEPEGSIEVPFLRVANVQDGFLNLENIHTIQVRESTLPRYLLRAGDVLMNEGGDFDKLGRGCIWDDAIKPCIHQNHVFAVRPHSVRPSWLNLYTSSMQANAYFISRSKQSTNLASISSTNLMDLPVPIASDIETSEIIGFLQLETGKVDALIAEQQRLIKLLQEKRQTVITHGVTKGLNPDAPMKNSGVEWFSEVPAHWEVGPLKHSWSIIDCKHVTAEFVLEGFPLASIREVQGRWVNLSAAKQTTEEFYSALIEGGRKPEVGDLIFSRNATVGEVAEVAESLPEFAMGQDVVIMKRKGSISSTFTWFLLRSLAITRQLDCAMIGSTFKRINVEQIRALMVPCPPTKEQEKIACHLGKLLQEYESLIDEAKSATDLLQERRSALISAAVTGQIDVRGLVPAEAAP
ncbi:restriction endonuclease subunit S [Cyanobium sp. FGCU-52]|nr:restriction endonuclease subunit S [Cyanobium sp. FGCU52]